MTGSRGIITTFLLGFLPPLVSAQNMVPNPGFEQMNDCNVDIMDHPIEGFIADWFTFNYSENTVDVLHMCLPIPELQPPNTIRGYSYPHSGEGMIGLCYAQESNYREVASVQLVQPLVKDSAYCVSFWVKNSRIENMLYWAKPLGVYFTDAEITASEISIAGPHVSSGEQLLSENEWVEISGYYIAQGSEQYLNIGFFGQNITKYQNMPYEPGGSKVPFYFFDDVSLTPCNKDSLLAVVLELPNVFTPNGDTVNAVYRVQYHNLSSLNMQVFNRWGNLVREYDGLVESWDGRDQNGTDVPEGVYFIKAVAESRFGETFSRQQFIHLFK